MATAGQPQKRMFLELALTFNAENCKRQNAKRLINPRKIYYMGIYCTQVATRVIFTEVICGYKTQDDSTPHPLNLTISFMVIENSINFHSINCKFIIVNISMTCSNCITLNKLRPNTASYHLNCQ